MQKKSNCNIKGRIANDWLLPIGGLQEGSATNGATQSRFNCAL